MSVDAFAEWVITDDYLQNYGIGKQHPGLVLFDKDNNKIPVMFAATPNASMTGSILCDMFARMDKLGITQQGEDAHWKYHPMAIEDGHTCQLDEMYLEYINIPESLWTPVLGAIYGTN